MRTRSSGRQLVLSCVCSRAVVRGVSCVLSGFAAPGGGCSLAPVRVPWWWLAACLSGVPRGPPRCAAPRPVWSLSVFRSAFATRWCLSPARGLSPPDLLGDFAGSAEAGREPGSLFLPLAPAEARVLGSLRVLPVRGPAMGVSLADASGVGLGLRALRWSACVDPVTDASGFLYRPSFHGGLGQCTGAVSCGRRHRAFRVGGYHARVLRVCACARSSWQVRAGRPPGRVLVRLTFPVAALSFCFAWPPLGWGRPLPVLLFVFLFFFFFPSRTYDFSSCFSPKIKVMHFQNGGIKLYTVVLLFLCFVKILTKLCCRWCWSCRSTVNNCRVREFQIPDRRAQ